MTLSAFSAPIFCAVDARGFLTDKKINNEFCLVLKPLNIFIVCTFDIMLAVCQRLKTNKFSFIDTTQTKLLML